MKQVRVQRKRHGRNGSDDAPADLLPVAPVSDTSAAVATLSRIDAALAER